jgi:hypothetical protein
MTSAQGRPYRPRLESLEDRALLTASFPAFRFLSSPDFSLRFAALTAQASGTHTPAEIRTVVSSRFAAFHSVSIVPQHISFDLSDQPNPVSVRGPGAGLSGPGLPGPTVTHNDPGFTTPGLPYFFTHSQPVTPPPLQVGGLFLNPDGTVGGSFP